MSDKECTQCHERKPLPSFHKNKRETDGHHYCCKACRKAYSRRYCVSNKEKITVANRAWAEKHPGRFKAIQLKSDLKRYNDLKDSGSDEYQELLRKKHKASKRYARTYPERVSITRRRRYDRDKRERPYALAWRSLLYRVVSQLGTQKEGSTEEALGYSALDLKDHMEGLFQDGMSWSNHGEWHIDHKRPVSSFNEAHSPAQVNALDNLQPLWSSDNIKKGAKACLSRTFA